MFFKKKKENHTSIFEIESTGLLVRCMVYDSGLVSPERISKALGLTPISSEGENIEEKLQDLRISRFIDLVPFLEAHASLSAIVSMTAYVEEMKNSEDYNPSPEEKDEMIHMFTVTSLAATRTCISALLEMNAIELTKKKRRK